MPPLDSLPGDQRAVLQLVLGRGRSYDQIAQMLSIDASAVRARALAALDSLGPATSVAPENLARISDYLLGQMPESDAAGVRDQLIDSPADRAWARVIASELSPLAAGPLPEIPTERDAGPTPVADDEPPMYVPPGMEDETAPAEPAAPAPRAFPTASAPAARAAAATGATPPPTEPPSPKPGGQGDGPRRRSSRVGGMILIGVVVLVVAAVIVVLLASGGSSTPKPAASTPTTSTTSSAAASASSTATTSGSGSTTTSGTTTGAKVLAQINLSPPSGSKASKAAGIAEVLSEGATDGVAIVAQNIPANTANRNAYAVWLYNSPTDAKILGFVNPGVGKTGRLSTAGGLPSNASHYKQLIVTLETSGSPKQPGSIILQGALSGVS